MSAIEPSLGNPYPSVKQLLTKNDTLDCSTNSVSPWVDIRGSEAIAWMICEDEGSDISATTFILEWTDDITNPTPMVAEVTGSETTGRVNRPEMLIAAPYIRVKVKTPGAGIARTSVNPNNE